MIVYVFYLKARRNRTMLKIIRLLIFSIFYGRYEMNSRNFYIPLAKFLPNTSRTFVFKIHETILFAVKIFK